MVRKLTDWLRRWHDVHITKSRPAPTSAKIKENPGAKAALLSGPPGIGKSTSAGLVARQEGYEVLELNASDVRNKGALTEQLAGAAFSEAMSMQGTTSKKRLIIMDEVDGMAGNGDRGGVQELIAVIKRSRVPFICICNDRQHQKVRSLERSCFDLRLRRPTKAMIAKRAVDVGSREGLEIEANAAELLAESCGNDIRQVLNCLQMWQRNQSATSVKYMDMKQRLTQVEKDSVLRLTAFDGARMILDPMNQSIYERSEGFFRDYMLVPLLVQENYVSALQASRDKTERLERMCMAAEGLSDADMGECVLYVVRKVRWFRFVPSCIPVVYKESCTSSDPIPR